MKKIIFTFTIFGLVILSAYLVITMPYRFYHTFQSEGVQSDYFIATDRRNILYSGLLPSEIKRGKTVFWKKIHFSNYSFDVPFQDVTFQVFPRPKIIKGRTYPYFDILDHKGLLVASVSGFQVSKFNPSIPIDEIFNLPIITQFIKPATNQQVWLDMLNLNIKIKNYNLYSYKDVKSLLEDYPISKLGYYLYIYKLRQKYFAHNAKRIVQNGPFHIIEEYKKDDLKGLARSYFYEKGRLYQFDIHYNEKHPDHNVVKDKMMKNLKLELSRDQESSLAMYNEFRKLKYQKRFDYQGMLLIYSAWSHELENQSFYKEMIYYLEKGDYKTSQLFGLYDFAKQKYGKTFSGRDEILKNDLKSKIEMEKAQELKKQERDLADYNIDGETEFKDEDSKIDYILKNVDVKEDKDDLTEY
ncbi:hypothetical protein [Halobacteriovorax sp.]|uniref:hypothetical protein n=1 Tax=Halobacteriovorax sp. TaxID=2020862 RepID=UPI003AF26E7C